MTDGLRRAFDNLWRSSKRRNLIPGRLGKPDGSGGYTVRVSNRPGWSYVRLGPEGNQGVTIAKNGGVPYRANLPVLMERTEKAGSLVIIGTDFSGGRLEYFAGGSDDTFNTAPHTHRIGSGLEYEIEALRMEPGRIRPYSGMEVYINEFRYYYSNAWITWPGGILDLTSYQPAGTGNWAWVLVGIDPSDNSATAVAGDEYSLATPLTLELLDDVSFVSYIPCVAIKIREDDTSVSNISRYQDARGWISTTGINSTALGEIFLAAAGGWPSTTNGCADAAKLEYVTNDIDLYSLDFDQTSIEYAQFSVWMPSIWNAGTVTFKAGWTAAGGSAAQTVEWNLQGRSYANDDPIDASWGSAIEVSDALIATGDIHYSAESSAVTLAGTPVADELVQFRVWRDATNDNLASDGKLIGIKVYYTRA